MAQILFHPKWWVGAAINDYKSKVIAVTGGLGAGKTDGLCTLHHHRVTLFPKAKFSMFFEPTHRLVETGAIPKYKKNLERMGFVEGVHYFITKNPHYKLTYNFGIKHEVLFHSFDRPDLIVSVDVSHATLDEAGDAEEVAFTNIRRRIRDTNAGFHQMFVGGAPQGVNWFADRFDSDQLEGWDKSLERDHREYKRGYRRFQLWTDDNADNLPWDYIPNLLDDYDHNYNLVKSYRFGIFCPLTKGAAVPNYNPIKHDIEDIDPDPNRDIWMSWDFNNLPLAWTTFQKLPFDEYGVRRFRFVEMFDAEEKNTQLDDAVLEFSKRYPVFKFRDTPIYIYGDRQGHSGSYKTQGTDYQNIKKYLERLGYRNVEIKAHVSNPQEFDSVEALQRLFSDDLLYLCKRCKASRRSLQQTTWKEGTRKIDKPSGETHTHHFDSMKYFAYAVGRDFDGQERKKVLGLNF